MKLPGQHSPESSLSSNRRRIRYLASDAVVMPGFMSSAAWMQVAHQVMPREEMQDQLDDLHIQSMEAENFTVEDITDKA